MPTLRKYAFGYLGLAAVVLIWAAAIRMPPPSQWNEVVVTYDDSGQAISRNYVSTGAFEKYARAQRVAWLVASVLALLGLPFGYVLVRDAIRYRRLSKGLCPRCKYPRGSEPVCSECGHSLQEA